MFYHKNMNIKFFEVKFAKRQLIIWQQLKKDRREKVKESYKVV